MKDLLRRIKNEFIIFSRNMFVKKQHLLKRPAQTAIEKKTIKKLFSFFRGRKINVFEYGCGYSTLYYAQYLYKNGYDFEWHCIDNSDDWFNKMKDMIKSKGFCRNVFIYLRSFIPFWEKYGLEIFEKVKAMKCDELRPTLDAERDYIDFPATIASKFDVIFVDGRFRRRVLLRLQECLKEGGVVVLHDAHKGHYHSSLKEYPYSIFIDGGKAYPFQYVNNAIWFGSMDNKDLIDRIKKGF